MGKIPEKLKRQIRQDPFYDQCCLHAWQWKFDSCGGRVTIDHAMIYAGRQIQELWSLLPLCEKHHGVCQYMDAGTLVLGEVKRWVALTRLKETGVLQYGKTNYENDYKLLFAKYGEYHTKQPKLC